MGPIETEKSLEILGLREQPGRRGRKMIRKLVGTSTFIKAGKTENLQSK
jgi:hypothetical protein